MSRVIYAADEFESQRPINADWKQEEKLADRLAKRHKIGARWNVNDEIEFFDLEVGQDTGMLKTDD